MKLFRRAPKPERYGHPFDPVAEVKRKLPPAPAGYLWELVVEVCKYTGNRQLELRLFDIAGHREVDSVARNLDQRSTGHTWAYEYARYPYGGRDMAIQEIVLPIVDWATTEVRRRTRGEGFEHYEVIA